MKSNGSTGYATRRSILGSEGDSDTHERLERETQRHPRSRSGARLTWRRRRGGDPRISPITRIGGTKSVPIRETGGRNPGRKADVLGDGSTEFRGNRRECVSPPPPTDRGRPPLRSGFEGREALKTSGIVDPCSCCEPVRLALRSSARMRPAGVNVGNDSW